MRPTPVLAQAGISIDHTFRPGDLGELIRIHGIGNDRDYGFNVVHEAYCARIAADFIIDGGGERGRVWLARRDGRVIGSVFIVEAADNAAQLRLLYVDDSARGLGLGRWLVDAAVTHCRSRGFDSVFLWTVDGLEAAIALYVAAGFQRAESSDNADWGRHARERRYLLELSA